ncbi:putative tRNA methyltransferase 9-like protein [Plasmopara halstedii]
MTSMASSCSPLAPTELEREHVHKVYDLIAPHFSHTRHHPWPQVTEFLDNLDSGALVADVGCGNGKYLCANSSLCMIGADRSIPLMHAGAPCRV